MDDKLPKCAKCYENPRHSQTPNGGREIFCGKCGCGVMAPTLKEAVGLWTRAMSAQAPGMEAMREALEHYVKEYCEGWCKEAGGTFNDCGGCPAATALQAAERGKA